MSLDNKPDPTVEESGGEGSLLRRWSERKAQARGQPPEMTEPPVAEPAGGQLSDADMPALDALDEHSDYRGFFSPKVSEALRRQALRKLFHMPQFNVLDGLDVYQEDFTRFAGLGDVITQEMRHRLELEARRIAESFGESAGDKQNPESSEHSAGCSAGSEIAPDKESRKA